MKIGAQFYTIRDYCKTLEDFSESLKKVADIGYSTVQISGTCAFDAQWLKEELDKNGLKCVITHTAVPRLLNETVAVCDEHKIFGAGCVGLGMHKMPGEDLEAEYAQFLELYKPVAKTIKEQGLYFMYHNHDHEFRKIGGKTILEKMAEDLAPDEMGFTLDTFWVQAGGGDPAQWVKNLAGRIPVIHLKDFAYGRKMAVVGEGNINFDRVFTEAEKAGTKYLLVEQDDCNGEDPIECLRRSYEYLKACGFN